MGPSWYWWEWSTCLRIPAAAKCAGEIGAHPFGTAHAADLAARRPVCTKTRRLGQERLRRETLYPLLPGSPVLSEKIEDQLLDAAVFEQGVAVRQLPSIEHD